MNECYHNTREAHSGFYLTLVSMMQSLALGYLLQSLGTQLFENGTLPVHQVVQAVASLLAIILVWHQYAMGTMIYRWSLDMYDSIIPYLLGISEYLIIAAMSIPEKDPRFGEIRFPLWAGALAAFAFVSIVAYMNQYFKAKAAGASDPQMIAASKKSLQQTLGCFAMFSLLACTCFKWPLPRSFQCMVSVCVSVILLGELLRVNAVYASFRAVEAPARVPTENPARSVKPKSNHLRCRRH